MFKIPQQFLPLALIFLSAIAALVIARELFVPETFGDIGHYRAASVGEIAALPIVYAGSEACYDCHDDSVDKGGLNLLDLGFKPTDHANFEKWERIFDRVKTGEMPPKKEPRPEADKKTVFLAGLKKPLIEADLADEELKRLVPVD